MKPEFDHFWTWLMHASRDYPSLGTQRKNEGLEIFDDEDELEEDGQIDGTSGQAGDSCDRPVAGTVRIGPGPDSTRGLITVTSGNSLEFERSVAEATWHRFHGMRQAYHRLHSSGVPPEESIPHQMASAYIRPTSPDNPYPQNWQDCPDPIRVPAYIAAAIRLYCRQHPHSQRFFPFV